MTLAQRRIMVRTCFVVGAAAASLAPGTVNRRAGKVGCVAISALLAMLAGGCHNRVPYPSATRAEFLAACPGEFWPWGSQPSREFTDRYCVCLLDEFERRWSADRVSARRGRMRTGGFRTLMGEGVAYPTAFMELMSRCKARTESAAG